MGNSSEKNEPHHTKAEMLLDRSWVLTMKKESLSILS